MKKTKVIDGIYSDVSDQVTKICETCKWASPFHTVEYMMCAKKGIVKFDYICKNYEYNRLLRHSSKKKKSIKPFSEDDFKID